MIGRSGRLSTNRVGRRQQPLALGVEVVGRLVARPVFRQQLARQTRVQEQELAPLVDQPGPGRERLLVVRLGAGRPTPARSASASQRA